MTDWKMIAQAADPPVPESAPAVALLERLEGALEPLLDSVPIDTLPWVAAVQPLADAPGSETEPRP
jgi:hypothetical protein